MPTIAALTTFTSNTQAKAAEVNANFSTIRTTVNTYCAFVDTAATISGAWTFTTAPTISGAMSFGAAVTITTGGLTVSAGGITVTGNSTITGTLNVSSTITGNGSGLTNLAAANLTGTLPNGVFPATLPAVSGANLTALNASNLASGTVPAARLPGTFGATTFSVSSGTTAALTATSSAINAPALLVNGYYSVYFNVNETGTTAVPAFSSNLPNDFSPGGWVWVRVQHSDGKAGFLPVLKTA